MADIPDLEAIKDEFSTIGFAFESEDALAQLHTVCCSHVLSLEDLVDFGAAFFMRSNVKGKDQVKINSDLITRFEKSLTPEVKAEGKQPEPSSATPSRGSSVKQLEVFRTPISAPRKLTSGAPDSAVQATPEFDSFSPVGRLRFEEAEKRSAKKELKRPDVAYVDRKNRGQVVAVFGALPPGSTWNSLSRSINPIRIQVQDRSSYLTEPYPLMFVKHQEVALTLNDNLEEISNEIMRVHDIRSFSAPDVIGDPYYTFGRILPSPTDIGNLDHRDLWFQTSSTLFNGMMCRLDLELVKSYSLFPGQIIAAKGHSTGKAFAASEILSGSTSKEVSLEIPVDGTLHVMVACGPYNILRDQQPDPLKDFIRSVENCKPDVVILMGPFVDEKCVEDENFMNATNFDSNFKSLMQFIFAKITEDLHVRTIIVPNAGQLVGMPVYPVPRFEMKDCVVDMDNYISFEQQQLVTFAPEPCLLNINGVLFGITSTDIVGHLCKREINRNAGDDRIARMAGHVLLQQSFYPLYPPEVAADVVALNKYAKIRQKPHVLITPSDMKGFAKALHGTVCVNPERLAKGFAGGSFGRIFISAVDEGQNDIVSRTAVDVVRI